MKSVSLLVALSITAPLFALDSALATARYTGACGDITLQMTADGAITRAIAATPRRRFDLTPEHIGYAFDFYVQVPELGITRIAVDLAPKTRDLTPKQVADYLNQIEANKEVRAAWKAHPGRWRESSTEHAKAILRCGDGHDEFQTTAEAGSEFVPQGTDPTRLKAGDTFRVILVRQSTRPNVLVRDTPFILLRDDGSRVAVVEPQPNGVLSFVVPLPGHYVLTATEIRPGDGKDFDWVSDTTTLSFAVN